MTNQTVTLDTKVVEQMLDALEATKKHLSEYLAAIGPLAPSGGRTETLLIANDKAITAGRAALASADRVDPVPTRIERKVYKGSAEHSEYLSARFTKEKQTGSFEWQGHRWAYHWTSFDDAGDFDVLYRNTTISGHRFGRLVASHREGAGNRHKWVCRCDCGGEARVTYTSLTNGDTKSCGCLRRQVTAERGRARALPGRDRVEYKAWVAIKGRCYNPRHQDFPHYGGRGIQVAEAWRQSFEQFIKDMGDRPEGFSIDRVDVNGDYAPGNCRWADTATQANNKRDSRYVTHDGEKLTVAQWARRQGMSKQCLLERLDAGWSTESALTCPVRFRSPNGHPRRPIKPSIKERV